MKNLDYYLQNISNTEDRKLLYLVDLTDIGGGKITKEQIDIIQNYPDKKYITISGLNQETFDYFIKNYGNQFEVINFWKCPLVNSFSSIELLYNVKYITYYWNQKAKQLWDFSKTPNLIGFSFNDFTRMDNLEDIAKSTTIEELEFGNKISSKYIVKSLSPLKYCKTLKNINFSANKIEDNDITPISKLPNLIEVNFPKNLFSTEQVVWLKAHLSPNIKSEVLSPFWIIDKGLEINGKKRDTFIIGKRKPFLSSKDDSDKIKKYINKFNNLYSWFKNNPRANTSDYVGK